MNKRTIACPKCQKKYSVSPQMSGKKMKCPSCQAVFVLNFGQAATQATNSPAATVVQPSHSKAQSHAEGHGPSSNDYAQLGLDGPLQGETDLLPESAPLPGQVAGLDNYAVDAGFGAVDPSRFVEEVHDPRFDNPLHKNPALSHAQQLARDIQSDSLGQSEEVERGKEKMNGTLRSVLSICGVFIGILILETILGAAGAIPPESVAASFIGTLVIFGFLIQIYYLIFVIRTFQVAPTADALLSLFVPGFVIYFIIKYWKDIKGEALSVIIMNGVMVLGVIVFIVGLIIVGAINPDAIPRNR